MTLLVLPEAASHWYARDGAPVYEIPYTDPKRAGETRPVTLADARKASLLPSVTNVLGILRKPGLEAWKAEQYILAALTLPRLRNESLDDFAHRVVRDADEESKSAAVRGSEIHSLIEAYFTGTAYPTPETEPYIAGFDAWWRAQSFEAAEAERCFANLSLGYAGRVDMIAQVDEGRFIVIDWKTQETTPGKAAKFYDEWALQLAGYAGGIGLADATLMNVVVSRNEPGRVEAKIWTEAERWWAAFHGLLIAWQCIKGYWPQHLND